MRFLGYDLTVTKAAPAMPASLRPLAAPAGVGGAGTPGYWPVTIREPFSGGWQLNADIRSESALAYFAVFACVTLIASDVAKLQLRLVEQDDSGIWSETTNPAYSPVLRQPNRYSTIVKFVERWIVSKLVSGNTYVLKQRDARGVVSALYVLDPACVTPLVAPDGSVFYELRREDLSWVADAGLRSVTVPASEIIHDAMVPIFHPLCGVTPLFACGLSILQGQSIQGNSAKFFANGSRPGGILTAPGRVGEDTAARLKATFEQEFGGGNQGRLLVVSDGLKYEGLSMTAVDAQLIDQLKITAETVCSCYHVPAYMVGVGPPPPYANVSILIQQYYAQCIQSLLVNFEAALDRGLEFPRPTIGVEFNTDDLSWMDTEARTKAAVDAIGGALMAPDEARKKYFGLGPVKGGDSPMAQQQYYSLAALAERDADSPFAKPTPATPAAPAGPLEAPAPDAAPVPDTTKALELVARAAVFEAAGPLEARIAAVAEVAGTAAAAVERRVLEAIGAERERIAVLEAREPIAGPPGPPGPAGVDGKDGIPGVPGMRYSGVFVDGRAYTVGDCVTYGGSLWHCNADTGTRPGDGAAAWTLAVKRGRDGKDR